MFYNTMFYLLLQWLVVQPATMGSGFLPVAAESSVYGIPLLYHYSNCSFHKGSSLSVHITNTQDSNAKIQVDLIHKYKGTINPAHGETFPLEELTNISLLLPDEQAKWKYQCLRYYCGGEAENNVCQPNPEEPSEILRGSDIQKLTGVSIISRWPSDSTTLTSLITREKGFANVVSLMPLTQAAHYTYYVLHGRSMGKYDVPTVGLMQPINDSCNFTINITLKENNTFVYKNNELLVNEEDEWTLWKARSTVWLQYQKPSLFKIESPHQLSVFTGFASSNGSYFSHHVRYAQQMPDTSQWGTQFIADLSVVEKYNDTEASLKLLTSNSCTVYITTQQNTYSFKMEAESTKIIPLQRNMQSSYLYIKSSQKLLILYEAYREIAEQNDTIFSIHLQPTEWHTYKQAATLIPPVTNTTQPYIITILAPRESTVYVKTVNTASVNLANYDKGTLLGTVDVKSYTLHTLTHHKPSGEEVLLFTANNTNNCSVRLGVTVYTPHYAHTNPPPLNDSQIQVASEECSRLPDHTDITVTLTSTVFTLVLLLVLIAVTVVVVLVKKPKILFRKPDPPFKDFEYDVFLSFADGDKELVKTLLYLPLRSKGYRVFWHLSDFIAGLSIAENMLIAIKKSRWVVYACSNYFDESQFCQQELRLGLDDHYRVHGGHYRRVIPVVLKGGTCPHNLKQLYPIQVHYKGQSPTSNDVNTLIKQLCFGKSVKVLQDLELTRPDRVVAEEAESLLDNYNTDV